MLVLSRKKNESVMIGDDITVTVIEIRGDKVRLGFEHPKEVSLHRREVYEAIQSQRTGPTLSQAPERAGPESEAPPPSTLAPPTTPPAVASERLILTERQVAVIDRFRESIRASSGADLSREDAVEMLLTAFEAAGRNLPAFVYGVMHGPQPS